MSASRTKLVTFSAVAAGIVVLGAAAVVEKDRIFERWYLYQLERAESKQAAFKEDSEQPLETEEGERAIAGLGEVGSETALVKLLDFNGSEKTELDQFLVHLSIPDMAIDKICDRIGEARFLAVVTQYVRDSAHDAGARARVATVPFEFRDFDKSLEITEAKEAAIAILSEMLDSEDNTASLTAAGFFESLSLDEARLDELSNAAKHKARKVIERLRAENSVRDGDSSDEGTDHPPRAQN